MSTTPVHVALDEGCGRSRSTSSFPVDSKAILGRLITCTCASDQCQHVSDIAIGDTRTNLSLADKAEQPDFSPTATDDSPLVEYLVALLGITSGLSHVVAGRGRTEDFDPRFFIPVSCNWRALWISCRGHNASRRK